MLLQCKAPRRCLQVESGAYHLYDKSQANACTVICILPGVFMRWISFFARAISFFDGGGDIISFYSLPGGFYIIPVSLFYIISVSLFYIISVSLFLFHYFISF